MKKFTMIAAALFAASTFSIVEASAQGRVRGARVNGAGGVTAGSAYNTGNRAGAHGVITDGQGNGAAGGASCASGAAGRACRAGATTVTADGAVQHQSGAQAQGANGGVASTQGSFTRSADGAYSAARTTSATGAAGNSYNAQTTYDSSTGVTRTVTCTDPTGAVIACPN